MLSSRPRSWPRGHSRTVFEGLGLGLGLGLGSQGLGLGLGLVSQGLGLGLEEKVLASGKRSWPRDHGIGFKKINQPNNELLIMHAN